MLKSIYQLQKEQIALVKGGPGSGRYPAGSGKGDEPKGEGTPAAEAKPAAEAPKEEKPKETTEERVANEVKRGEEAIKNVNWRELESNLSSQMGTPIKLTPSIGKDWSGNRPYIKFESQDLTDQAGIFKAGLKSVKLTGAGSDVFNMEKDNSYGANMTLRFELKDGGSNGIGIGRAFHDMKTKKWDVRPADEGRT